jgi:hypothetical protein
MDEKTIGVAGIILTFLLTFNNAAIRYRERRKEVPPLMKYLFAWL